MTESVNITLYEKPISWLAPERHGNRYFDKRYADKQRFRRLIAEQYQGKVYECAVILSILFCFEPPKSTSKKKRKLMIDGEIDHIVKPDGSNCNKLIEDCLKGIVIKDDSQVVSLRIDKKWGEKNAIVLQIIPKVK